MLLKTEKPLRCCQPRMSKQWPAGRVASGKANAGWVKALLIMLLVAENIDAAGEQGGHTWAGATVEFVEGAHFTRPGGKGLQERATCQSLGPFILL